MYRAGLLAVWTLVVWSGAAQPATVSGSIQVGATKVVPKAVTATSYKSTLGEMTTVLVSDKPGDTREFAELTKVGAGEPLVPAIFEGAWKNLHFKKALSGFVFTASADKKLVSNEVLVGGPDDIFSLAEDDLVVELKSVAPRVAGRVRTKEPVLSLGTLKVGIDITIDAPVTAAGK